ncbi:MAG TPA: hypothetical protein VFQ43_14400 [Nitrososphaera sp.]|nr:hypothetical protein [Nitrososphaera sp.]
MTITINDSGLACLLIALNNSVTRQKDVIEKQGDGGFDGINTRQLRDVQRWQAQIEEAMRKCEKTCILT